MPPLLRVAGGDSSAMVESVGLALTKIPDVLTRVTPSPEVPEP